SLSDDHKRKSANHRRRSIDLAHYHSPSRPFLAALHLRYRGHFRSQCLLRARTFRRITGWHGRHVELAFGPIASLACFRENVSLEESLIKLTLALQHCGTAWKSTLRERERPWKRKSWSAGQSLREARLPLACWGAAHPPQWWRASSRRLLTRRSRHFRIKF